MEVRFEDGPFGIKSWKVGDWNSRWIYVRPPEPLMGGNWTEPSVDLSSMGLGSLSPADTRQLAKVLTKAAAAATKMRKKKKSWKKS